MKCPLAVVIGLVLCFIPAVDLLNITFGLCEERVRGQPVRLCCQTEGLGRSGVRISNSNKDFGIIECRNYTHQTTQTYEYMEVQCHSRYDVTVYAMTPKSLTQPRQEIWTCEAYTGFKSEFKFLLEDYLEFDKTQGPVVTQTNETATVEFAVPATSYTAFAIYRHDKEGIARWKNYDINIGISNTSKYTVSRRKTQHVIRLLVHHVAVEDAGTYWIAISQNTVQIDMFARSLVVVEPPSRPVIRYQDVTAYRGTRAAKLYCKAVWKTFSTNLFSFLPNVTYHWTFPNSSASFQSHPIQDGGLQVNDINCSKYSFPPIGCSAVGYGIESEAEWFTVRDLCGLPAILEKTTHTVTKIPGTSVFSIISMVMFSLMILASLLCSLKYYRKSTNRQCCRMNNPFCRLQSWWRGRRGEVQLLEDMQPSPTDDINILDNEESARGPIPTLSARIHECRQQHAELPLTTTTATTQLEHETPSREELPTRQPTLSARIHELRRLPQQQPILDAGNQPGFQPGRPPTSHQVPSGGQLATVISQPIPNINGGFSSVPVTVSPISADAGAGHVLNEMPTDVLDGTPTDGDLWENPVRFETGLTEHNEDHVRPVIDTTQHSRDGTVHEQRSVASNELTLEAILHLSNLHGSLKTDIIVQLTRDDVVDDLINFYTTMDQQDATANVIASFVGEDKSDITESTRDMYKTFWREAVPRFFTGTTALVPKRSLHANDMVTYVTLGRIFAHSTAILQEIPIRLCRSTLYVVIFGELEPFGDTANVVIEDFLLFVDSKDKRILEKALGNFDGLSHQEKTTLQGIFANYDMPNIPRKESFMKDLTSIAHNELCTKPKMVCDEMGKGIPEAHRQMFWGQMTLGHIDGLYHVFRSQF